VRAADANGRPVELPEPDRRRDGSGVALPGPVAALGGPITL
jgi:DNA gyrase subunit A